MLYNEIVIMANNIPKAKDLSGLSIYQDPKKGTIFYDFFTGRSFLISNSDVKTYMLSTMILPVCVLLTFLIKSFISLNLVKSILLFIVLFVIAEILFRVLFVYKLTEIEDYRPPKKEGIINFMAANYSRTRLIVLLILLLLLTIMMPLYAHVSNFQGGDLYVTYAVSLAAIAGMVLSILAIIRQSKK